MLRVTTVEQLKWQCVYWKWFFVSFVWCLCVFTCLLLSVWVVCTSVCACVVIRCPSFSNFGFEEVEPLLNIVINLKSTKIHHFRNYQRRSRESYRSTEYGRSWDRESLKILREIKPLISDTSIDLNEHNYRDLHYIYWDETRMTFRGTSPRRGKRRNITDLMIWSLLKSSRINYVMKR